MRDATADAYLDRIGYTGAREPTLDVLRAVHAAHLHRVPFENLSIHANEPISLELGALYDKIVTRRRGGFCYELNGLFAWLLRELGFRVELLAARVYGAGGALGIPFDHLALRVELDEPWLADVGFGDSFVHPLRLGERDDQDDGGRVYRLAPDGDAVTLSRRGGDGALEPQYRFELRPYELADFAGGCRYHQTSPDSPFVRRPVCSLLRASGRVTLAGRRLIFTTPHGLRIELPLPDAGAARDNLRIHFGIDGDPPGLAL